MKGAVQLRFSKRLRCMNYKGVIKWEYQEWVKLILISKITNTKYKVSQIHLKVITCFIWVTIIDNIYFKLLKQKEIVHNDNNMEDINEK
jgi:hypothetical protein